MFKLSLSHTQTHMQTYPPYNLQFVSINLAAFSEYRKVPVYFAIFS